MSKKGDTSTRKIAAATISAVAGGATAGAIAHKIKADKFANQLIDGTSEFYTGLEEKLSNAKDKATEEKMLTERKEIIEETFNIIRGPKFQAKVAPLRQGVEYSKIISSRHGLDYLECPELIDEMRILPTKDGTYIARVMLNEDGLRGITPEIAKAQRMVKVKFDQAGKAIQGGFIIHHIPEMPEVAMLVANTEKNMHEVPTSQLSRLGNWIRDAEVALKSAEAHIDGHKIPEFTKAFRESAPNGWCWKHMPKSEKLVIGGTALVGTVVGGIIGSELVYNKHQKRELQRQQEADQTLPFAGL